MKNEVVQRGRRRASESAAFLVRSFIRSFMCWPAGSPHFQRFFGVEKVKYVGKCRGAGLSVVGLRNLKVVPLWGSVEELFCFAVVQNLQRRINLRPVSFFWVYQTCASRSFFLSRDRYNLSELSAQSRQHNIWASLSQVNGFEQ
jgi:hypothetical protein